MEITPEIAEKIAQEISIKALAEIMKCYNMEEMGIVLLTYTRKEEEAHSFISTDKSMTVADLIYILEKAKKEDANKKGLMKRVHYGTNHMTEIFTEQ